MTHPFPLRVETVGTVAERQGTSLTGRTVVLAGATSAAGRTATSALRDAGARVIATGRSSQRLQKLADAGAEVVVTNATRLEEMADLASRIGAVDAVIPLVGGWRGGGGLAGQSDEDLDALLPSLEAVRATSRAFDSALQSSDAGRFVVLSSTAVACPLAGGANYAAIKAASEAWTRAVAQGYAKAARASGKPLRAASVIFRAKSLGPEIFGARIRTLWNTDAADLNGQVFDLG